jgi:hypothetical protein
VKKPTMVRQGDVLLVPVREIPKGARRLDRVDGRLVLAEGEVSGHAHAIQDDHADLYLVREGDVAEMRRRFLRVEAEVATLVHEEHAPITLPPGDYEVRRQREWVPAQTSRPVFD